MYWITMSNNKILQCVNEQGERGGGGHVNSIVGHTMAVWLSKRDVYTRQ